MSKQTYDLDTVYSGHRGLVPPGTTGFKEGEERVAKDGEWFLDTDGSVTRQRGGNGSRAVRIVVPIDATGTDASTEKVAEREGSFNAPWWDVCEEVLKHSRRILLYGPPGTGKTTLGVRTGKDKGQTVTSITLNEDTAAQEVVGHFVFKGNNTVWHDGPAIRAWKGDGKKGGVLVINEIGEASGPVLTALYAVLDDPEVAEFVLASGEVVRPCDGFRVIATTNEDPEVLPEALLDRFDVTVCADKPTPAAIEAIPDEVVRVMVTNSYEAFNKGGDRQQLITYREAASFARLRKNGVRLNIASLAVFGNKRGPEFVRDYKLTAGREGISIA